MSSPQPSEAKLSAPRVKRLTKAEKSGIVSQPLDIKIGSLKEKTTTYTHLTRAGVRDTNHISAFVRGVKEQGWPDEEEMVAAFTAIMKDRIGVLDVPKNTLSRDMLVIVESLPVANWVKTVPGAGLLNLALIIGMTGDIGNYPTVAKLWKRLGLAVMFNGERQRKFADAQMALVAGYSPKRRATVWILGDCLLKQNYLDREHEQPGYYRRVFDDRFVYELNNLGVTREQYDPKKREHIRAKMRAKRYMEKRFIKHLWQHWHRQSVTD